MTTIKAPVAGFSGRRAGVVFVDGEAQSDDEAALAYFRRHGYIIGDEQDESGPKTVESMNVAELRAYAEDHGIDLGDATRKPEIRAAIQAALDAIGDEQDED